MDTFFRDRTAKVLVVDSSGASRTLLTEVIRSLGFGDVLGVPTLKDALGVLEVEPVRWLISSVFADQNENLMQIMKLQISHPELKHLRVTALIDESELELLPFAFEKGLLSYQRKPFTKDSLQNDLKELCSRYENFGWQSSQLAGSYLRQCLMGLNAWAELLTFERQMLKMLPGDFQQLLNLVPALAKTGKAEEAKAILKQVSQVDSSLESQVKALCTTYLEGASLDNVQANVNILGLKSALIVDNDSTVQNEVKAALGEMGVENIQVFDDGQAALDYIKAGNIPDLVIQEWRVPRLTGPLFLQKAQEEGAKGCPFVLLSSLVQKEDIPFVREMGVSQVLGKPLQRKDLIQGLIWTIQQDRQPTEQGSMERKMRQLLSERKTDEALSIKERFMADATIQIGARHIVEAEFAYVQGDFEKCRDHGIEAIKHSGESIFILNLLGKALISLRDFETALKCFQKAQNLAPMNLERLCQIAEIHSELGDNEKARELLGEVSDLDPDSQKAKESAAKVEINDGNINSAKKIMSQLRAIENVVSYMNNQAIAMARCGMIDEGLNQYTKTIDAIPDDKPDTKSIVQYNMGLAYLRSQRLPEAKERLTAVIGNPQSKVFSKAQNLLKKVSHAIDKGVQLHVAKAAAPDLSVPGSPSASTGSADDGKSHEEKENIQEMNKSRVIAAVENRPGDVACYMIYNATMENAKVKKMLEHQLRFNPRKAIERSETMGADRLLAQG